MASVARWVREGTADGWGYPLKEGWYFDSEDENMYGPYKTKELCENAFIRYCADLDKTSIPTSEEK